MSTEHAKVTLSPTLTVIGAEGEMDTEPMSTANKLRQEIYHEYYEYHYSQMLT